VVPPAWDEGLLVFSQQIDASIAVGAWNAHAVRFFGTRVGLAEDPVATDGSPRGGPDGPTRVRWVVAPDGEAPGVRTTWSRARSPEDLAVAEAADARAGGGGLGQLARRCPTIWIVERSGFEDTLALRLAAILASVLLGPIVDPRSGEIFGVRTARDKLVAR